MVKILLLFILSLLIPSITISINPTILNYFEQDELLSFLKNFLSTNHNETSPSLKYLTKEDVKRDTEKDKIKLQILLKITEILLKHSNTTIIYNDFFNNRDCFNNVQSTKLETVIRNSGKDLADIGLEDECNSNDKFIYLFFEYNLKNSKYFDDHTFHNLYSFTNQHTFFLGLCLWKNCRSFYDKFLQNDINPKFYDFLNDTLGLTDLVFYPVKSLGEESEEAKARSNTLSKVIIKIFFWVIFSMLCFMILMTIFGIIYFSDYKKIGNSSSGNDYSGSNELSSGMKEQSAANNFFFINKLNDSKEKSKFSYKCQMFLFRIYKFLTLGRAFKYLYKVKNKYYDDRNLEMLAYVRFILLFMLTFNRNITTLLKTPHRDFGNFDFYLSYWFSFVKLTSFAPRCLIILDGFYYSFKLMSFIKNEGNTNFSTFLKFYFNVLTKSAVFMISFLVFHLFLYEFGSIFTNSYMFDFFLRINVSNKQCVDYPLKILIPFYLNYFSNFSEIELFACFRYLICFLTEFYCITFTVILFYILHKIKSKKLDIFIFILNCLHFFASFVYFDKRDYDNDYYTLDYFLGEKRTLQQPHLMFIDFFFAVNAGLIYFYFVDVNNSSLPLPDRDKTIYIPFEFNYSFMKIVDNASKTKKIIFCFLTALFMILLSSTYYFFLKYFSSKYEESTLYFNFTPCLQFIYIYEQKIFGILFLIMLIIFLFYPREHSFKNNNFSYIPLNRCCFAFVACSDTIIYLFYSINNIQIYINYQNLLFLTIGLMFYIFLISFLITMFFELPLRIAYKKLYRTPKIKEN